MIKKNPQLFRIMKSIVSKMQNDSGSLQLKVTCKCWETEHISSGGGGALSPELVFSTVLAPGISVSQGRKIKLTVENSRLEATVLLLAR